MTTVSVPVQDYWDGWAGHDDYLYFACKRCIFVYRFSFPVDKQYVLDMLEYHFREEHFA